MVVKQISKMARYNCLLNVFIILVFTQAMNTILALSKEAIVGGSIGSRTVLKYQAALAGKRNYTRDLELLCGAGIIHDQFVLTSARCFFNSSRTLRIVSYIVIAGTANLKLNEGMKIEVDLIYMFAFINASHLSDIAVLKLKGSLHLDHNRHASKIELPTLNQEFNRKIVLVSGYGANQVKTMVDLNTKKELRIMDSTDLLLRFAVANIVDNQKCKALVSTNFPDKQLCGLLIPVNSSEPSGLCKADRGNPLIIGNTIIGIASRIPANCDNRYHGSIYTKVSAYVDFIQAVLDGELQRITSQIYIHVNPLHIA